MVEFDNICSVEQVDAVLAELDKFRSERDLEGCVATFVRFRKCDPSSIVGLDFARRHEREFLNDGNYQSIRSRAYYESLRDQLSKAPSGA